MKKNKYDYYDEFIKISDDIMQSSNILNNTLKEYSKESVLEKTSKVHDIENDADNILHSIKNYLARDFLPPINREDISLIGNSLDDIEDEIDEILINFDILNIEKLRDSVFDFGNVLSKCCVALKEMMYCFKDFKKKDIIKEKAIEINKLEEEGDKIYQIAMKELYSRETDSIEIIRWTTIFNCFEDAIDACEYVANVVEDIILKNS